MTKFFATKTVCMMLVISSLLVLLPGCEKKGSAEKAGEKIDNVIENFGEKLEEASDNFTSDGLAESIGEDIDVAAKNAGEKIKEVNSKIQDTVKGDEE